MLTGSQAVISDLDAPRTHIQEVDNSSESKTRRPDLLQWKKVNRKLFVPPEIPVLLFVKQPQEASLFLLE